MQTLKKIVASGVIFSTVLSLSVAVSPVKAATVAAGDLIKGNQTSAVYLLGADNKKYVFPNEATYKSWYPDFSGVKTISQTELETNYPDFGGNVTMRPGTKLVKTATSLKVYAVLPGGQLSAVPDEATAKALYGADWSSRIVVLSDSFITNYKSAGTSVLSAAAFPAGSLVKFSKTSPDLYYIGEDGKARKIASEAALTANGFNAANILDGSALTMPATGTDITAREDAIANTVSGASSSTNSSASNLTVALSGTTPAAASIIAGQSLASLASFNLTAASTGDVKVTSVSLKRTGISQDATLKNVYLYEGNTRLTDAAAVASGVITFTNASGIVTVAKGTTKTLTVKSDIDSTASGQTVGAAINAASDIVTDGAPVSGSFPASGNLMSVVTGTQLTTVSLSATTNPTGGTVNPADTGVVVWSNTVTVSNHDANFKYLRLREIGSIMSTDLKDFELYVGGVKVSGPVQMSSDYYVAFDMTNSPVAVKAGSKLVEVRASVVGGSSKNYSFSLRYPVDIVVEDVQYGVSVSAVTAPSTTAFTPATSGSVSVAAGTLTVDKKADSPTGNVTKDSTATLGRYTVTAFGEPIKIETLKFGFTAGGVFSGAGVTSLRNGKVLANGGQIGSTANLAAAGTTYTVNYTVNPGTPVTLEIVADLVDTASTTAIYDGTTVTASMLASTGNAQAQSSLGLVNVPHATNPVPANQLTVKVGSLSLAKTNTYASQTVVVPQTTYKLGSYILTGNSTEDVTINSITADFVNTNNFLATALSNVYVKYGSTTSPIKPTVASTSNLFSVSSLNLPKNGTLAIEIWGNISSTPTNGGTMITRLQVGGQTVGSGQSVTTALTPGQTISVGTGTFSASFNASPDSAIIVGNQTADVATYKFSAVNNTFNIDELTFTVASSTVVGSLLVKDGATVITTVPLSGNTAVATGMTLPVSGNKTVTIALALGSVGTGAGDTGSNVAVTLTGYKVTPSGQAQTSTTTLALASNPIYVYKTIPTISTVALPTTVLADGTQTLAKVSVTADAAGAISWDKITFKVSSSSPAGTIGISNHKLLNGSGNVIPGSFNVSGTSVTFTPTSEQTVSTTANYSLVADITGTVQNSSVSTTIAQPSAYAVSVAAASVGGSSTFVWSDQSDTSHSLLTPDWTNDYLVKNLANLGSQTMTR